MSKDLNGEEIHRFIAHNISQAKKQDDEMLLFFRKKSHFQLYCVSVIVTGYAL